MKKITALFLLFTFVFSITLSQTRIQDLENKLPSSSNQERVDVLNELSYLYEKSDYKKALKFQDEAVELAKKLNYKEGLGQAYQNLGNFNKVRSNFKAAIKYYGLALRISEEFNNVHAQYLMNYCIGLCYGSRSDFNNSKMYFDAALKLAESLPVNNLSQKNLNAHYGNIAGLYVHIGDILIEARQTNKAMDYYEKGIKYAVLSNDTKHLISTYVSMAGLLISSNEFKKSQAFLDSAFYYGKRDNLSLYLIQAFEKRARLNMALNRLDEALNNCDSAISICRNFNEFNLITETNILKGEIYFKKNEIKKAEDIYRQGIKDLKKANSEVALGNAYYKLGELLNKTENLEESNKYLNLAESILKKSNAKDVLQEVYYLLSDNAEKLKDIQTALDYQAKSNKLMDSTKQQNISTLIKNYELKKNIEKKNRETELAKKDFEFLKLQNKYILVVSLVSILALFIISLLLYSRYRLKSRTSKQLAALNATKDKFFTIISHDLKSPVSSFNNLAELLSEYYQEFNDEEKLKYLNSLKESSGNILSLLENLLTWSSLQTDKIRSCPDIIILKEIIESEVVNLSQVIERKSINLSHDINPNHSILADLNMTKTVVRNLISNALKYTADNGSIIISSSEKEDSIEVSITDNGVGIEEKDKPKLFKLDIKHSTLGTSNEKGTGLGLNLCKEFVERNRGSIWFESKAGVGSTFYFELPKVKNHITETVKNGNE